MPSNNIVSSTAFRDVPAPLSASVREVPSAKGLLSHTYTEPQVRAFLWSKLVSMGRKKQYEGTVPFSTVTARRAKNRVAKASRKKNRSK